MIAFVFIAVIGLIFGSFITLASHRLPQGEDIVLKPSRCPQCDTPLRARDLFPLLSWLATRGKCRHCGARVHWRYPAIELVTAAAFVAVYAAYGPTWQAVALMALTVMLLIMIVVDFEHYIIPDEIHCALAPLALVYRFVLAPVPWEDVAGGCMLGLCIGLALHHGYRYLRKKEGLGFGDVKFLAVTGLWLGVRGMVPFLFYSGLLGVVTALIWRLAGRGPRFPFGPALALALFICLAFPEVPAAFWELPKALLQ